MPTVNTLSGPVSGKSDGSVLRFAGIPYAAPPVGELRWKPAQPMTRWEEVRDATRFGASAPQPFDPSGTRDQVLGGHGLPPFDEDCLTLNVWTPACDDARRPVLVWIHGGGFISGSGTLPIYHGDKFAADGDLVVVSINYRLGPLGFWAAPDGGESNLWLSDQIAALRWVQANAAAFGGDPDQITVAGESGGAFSALTLATLPETSALIRRVILQSPPIGLALATVEDAARTSEMIAETLGLDDLEMLRHVPTETLIGATMALSPRTTRLGHWSTPIRPILDGLLTRHPLDAAIEGAADSVDMIVGWNAHEATFAFALNPALAGMERSDVYPRLGERFSDAQAAYSRYEHDARRDFVRAVDVLSAVESDELFVQPSIELAQARARRDRAALVYEFALESPAHGGALGATHCLELPFTFDNLDRWSGAPFAQEIDPVVAARVAGHMHEAWIAFASGVQPEGWPRYGADRAVMRFSPETTVERDVHPRVDLFAAPGLPMRARG